MLSSTRRKIEAIESHTRRQIEVIESQLTRIENILKNRLAVEIARQVTTDELLRRVSQLETTLTELTGNSPGMWTQVHTIRTDLSQLITATGCYKLRVPDAPAIPSHTVIKKLPRTK